MSVKRWAKRVLFGGAYVSESTAIGLVQSQRDVRVFLDGTATPVDVSNSNVICATNPLLIGIGHPCHERELRGANLKLRFQRTTSARVLGEVHLQYAGELPCPAGSVSLFRAGCTRRYFPSLAQQWAGSAWIRLRQNGRQSTDPHASEVSPADRDAVFALYLCPRPVFTLTAAHETDTNILPMDLMGPVAPSWWCFALGADKPVLNLIRGSGRFVAASVPASHAAGAYRCGRNHKIRSIALDSLPFQTGPSPRFSLPIPEFALDVREFELGSITELGSHSVLLAREVCHNVIRSGEQLHLAMAAYVAACRPNASDVMHYGSPRQEPVSAAKA